MQVAIFGATGSIGSHLVKQSLSKGYKVKAFTRNPAKLSGISDTALSIVQGDVNNLRDVENAMSGIDCVLCSLGDGSKGRVRATGTKNIIQAMELYAVRRLVCQTTLGLGDSWNNLNFFWKYIMFGFFLKQAFEDHKQQEEYISNSSLIFTLVRPSAFTDKPSTNKFKVGFGADTKDLTLKISRADVACFMIEQLTSKEFINQPVSISN